MRSMELTYSGPEAGLARPAAAPNTKSTRRGRMASAMPAARSRTGRSRRSTRTVHTTAGRNGMSCGESTAPRLPLA
ncbi:MAG: hypothetical protein LC624_12745 [Halobacteriales archaeon]|nr:hypothetical protein [Halobacteriales archaeon]